MKYVIMLLLCRMKEPRVDCGEQRENAERVRLVGRVLREQAVRHLPESHRTQRGHLRHDRGNKNITNTNFLAIVKVSNCV